MSKRHNIDACPMVDCLHCARQQVSDELRSAVLAERERCARIAEAYIHNCVEGREPTDELEGKAAYSNATCRHIAAAIREEPKP